MEMTPVNGQHMNGDFAERDAERIAAREPVPTPPEPEQPFGQNAHDLLLRSIEAVSDNWVEQLKAVRDNNAKVEQLVIERAAKVKTDITQLYLLGNAVALEVKHGLDFNAKVESELTKLMETH